MPRSRATERRAVRVAAGVGGSAGTGVMGGIMTGGWRDGNRGYTARYGTWCGREGEALFEPGGFQREPLEEPLTPTLSHGRMRVSAKGRALAPLGEGGRRGVR